MAMKECPAPYRQIHLDFHTGPWIRDVGRDFKADKFARTMRQAQVNSVTCFAKCHHGHLYYNTRRPERHPGLKPGLNLLGEQVAALHRAGIRAPIYIGVQCDEYAADTHPEWIARTPEGSPVGAGPLAPGWQILDLSSPYQEYLAEQTAEVLKLFHPVDGIFFDMCWDQPSLNNYAVEGLLREGFDPEKEADRKAYAHRVALRFMRRFFRMIKAANPRATVYFNSRPLANLAEEIGWLTQVEIEALPTGGWGYMYFPKNVRFVRSFGRPYLGMTARFHKSWADFGGLKPRAALEYEVGQMLAHGARCSIGDQLHPRGTLDPAAYDLIGGVYRRVAACEPWLKDFKPVAQIGLFPAPTTDYYAAGGTNEGATRVLTQLKHQFDIIPPDGDLSRYELLILPDSIALDPGLIGRLQAYLRRGGALLASGASGLNAEANRLLLPELGIQPRGWSEFATTYLRFGERIAADVPAADHVFYDRGVRVRAGRGAQVLARVVAPYFDRSWRHFSSHNQTPADRLTPEAGVVLKGRAAYVAYPIFGSIANHGNYPYRLLLRNLIDLLLPEPLVRIEAPTGMEVTVTRNGRQTVVHLLYFTPERRTPHLDLVEDIVPLFDIPLSLSMERAPRAANLVPSRRPLAFEYRAGRVHVRVPELRGHALLCFE